MLSRLDPLIGRAARWLDVLGARRRPRSRAGTSASDREVPTHELTESVAVRLQAVALCGYAWLDVGVWGRLDRGEPNASEDALAT